MSIIERIRRIARANIHSLLDKADTPEMALQDKIGKIDKHGVSSFLVKD